MFMPRGIAFACLQQYINFKRENRPFKPLQLEWQQWDLTSSLASIVRVG